MANFHGDFHSGSRGCRLSENGGYTALPNCLPDIYMRAVSDVQYKVLDCIARKTLGWQKRWDGIPLSQFEEMTGKSRPAIVKAIAELVERKIILCGKGQGRASSQSCPTLYPTIYWTPLRSHI